MGKELTAEQIERCDAIKMMERRYGLDTPEAQQRIEGYRQDMEIGQDLYALRTAAGLSQAALGRLAGTSGPAIARAENAAYRGHSLNLLRRIAAALGKRVEVRFVDAAPAAATAPTSAVQAPEARRAEDEPPARKAA
jgi:transcriptional regulator with XRE-family HTH domain